MSQNDNDMTALIKNLNTKVNLKEKLEYLRQLLEVHRRHCYGEVVRGSLGAMFWGMFRGSL